MLRRVRKQLLVLKQVLSHGEIAVGEIEGIHGDGGLWGR